MTRNEKLKEALNQLCGIVDSAVRDVWYEDLPELEEVCSKLDELQSLATEKWDELDGCDLKTEEEAREAYDQMLDECYQVPDAPSWMGTPSEAMKVNDPIMYRIGFNEWLDGESRESGRVVPDQEDWDSGY